jgi:HK97 family phage prohead protease
MPDIEVLTRTRSLDADALTVENENTIRMIASTNAPVRVAVSVDGERQMWEEVLEHSDGKVDVSACRAILVNHDADLIAGVIRSISFDGSTSIVTAELMPDAKLPSGVRVVDAVRAGALKGVSIGYGYDTRACSIDYEKRQIVVPSWRMSEVTLTPIPADTSAGVRSLTSPGSMKGTSPMTEVPADKAGTAPVATPAVDVAAVRAESAKIVTLAESLKLRGADYVGLALPAAQEKMLADLAERDAKNGGTPKATITSHVEVGEEHAEKVAKRAVGALLWSAGFQHTNERCADHEFADGSKLADYQRGNELRGKTVSDVIRSSAEALGIKVGSLDRHDVARMALGLGGQRDAANVTAGFFPNFVFLNVIKKAVSVGYTMGSRSIKYQPLVSRNYVPDYKQFAIGGLGVGNLSKTAENVAFPELDKAEGVYLDRVSMWGGTMSLTEQAIVSDDTGRFFDNLRMAGVIAQKTIDKRVFQVLLRGISTDDATSTWTNNTTGSATIVHTTNDTAVAARANLSKVEAALMNKIGLDGNPTGNMASFLVVPPDLAYVAAGLMGIAPGQQNQTALRYNVISSPWLQFSALTGQSATSYYLIADPSEATGLVLSTINGIEEPRVEQYDPGAVAAYKWKIYMPFEAGMGAHTYGGSTLIAGVQQGTV